MAFKIGANIALDGEKEFRAAVADMNGNLKVLQSEMKALTSTFGAEKKSIEQATAQQKNLTAQYDQQAEKVKQLEAALADAVKNFGEGSKEARNWEIQLNNAKAAMNNTQKELDKTNKELEQLKKQDTAVGKLKTAFHDLKEKVEEAEKKTKKLREALKDIKYCDIQAITFFKRSVRDYFVVSLTKEHSKRIGAAIQEMTSGVWGAMCRER